MKEMVKKVEFVDTMKAYGGVELPLHLFLTLDLDGQEWSTLLHCLLNGGGDWAVQSAWVLCKIENSPDTTGNRTRAPQLLSP